MVGHRSFVLVLGVAFERRSPSSMAMHSHACEERAAPRLSCAQSSADWANIIARMAQHAQHNSAALFVSRQAVQNIPPRTRVTFFPRKTLRPPNALTLRRNRSVKSPTLAPSRLVARKTAHTNRKCAAEGARRWRQNATTWHGKGHTSQQVVRR